MTISTDPKPTAAKATLSIKHKLAGWVEQQIKMGDNLSDAAIWALEKAIQEDLAADILRELGEQLIVDIWRKYNREFRGRSPKAARHISAAVLNREESLTESMWNIGGQWHRLGSMDFVQLQELEAFYIAHIRGAMKDAKFFGRLKAAVKKKGGVVEDHFTGEQLKGLQLECANE